MRLESVGVGWSDASCFLEPPTAELYRHTLIVATAPALRNRIMEASSHRAPSGRATGGTPSSAATATACTAG
jgi:hypothetical protein